MSSNRIYNILSVVLILVIVAVIVGIVVLLLQDPEQGEEVNSALIPTIMELATDTPTYTPTNTLTPTITLTPTSTYTLTPTLTITPSITMSPTITTTPRPTDTPTVTPTPSTTATNTPTPTATGPTATLTPSTSPFPFALRESIRLTNNFANPAAGCAWQGIGGDVRDLNGNKMSGNFQVRVFNAEFEQVTLIGTNSLYGDAGWEVTVSTQVNNRVYFVQLETTNRVQISPRIEVQFPGTCDQNAAIVVFIQKRAF